MGIYDDPSLSPAAGADPSGGQLDPSMLAMLQAIMGGGSTPTGQDPTLQAGAMGTAPLSAPSTAIPSVPPPASPVAGVPAAASPYAPLPSAVTLANMGAQFGSVPVSNGWATFGQDPSKLQQWMRMFKPNTALQGQVSGADNSDGTMSNNWQSDNPQPGNSNY